MEATLVFFGTWWPSEQRLSQAGGKDLFATPQEKVPQECQPAPWPSCCSPTRWSSSGGCEGLRVKPDVIPEHRRDAVSE